MSDCSTGRLAFSRAMRLKHGRDFSRLRRDGRRASRGAMVANWVELPPGSVPRLGLIATKTLGSAVIRNRARRLLRETFRLHQRELRVPVDLVLVARHSISRMKLAQVERDFLTIMRQAGML